MPEHNQYPEPNRLSQEQIIEINRLCEAHFGPIIGTYTPRVVSRGIHPEEVKKAWEGVVMPVRQQHAGAIENGLAPIAAPEAFNALVAADTAEEVLQYWIDRLPPSPATTLTFSLEEGVFEAI